MVARAGAALGRAATAAGSGLRDLPRGGGAGAATAPALLQSFDLAGAPRARAACAPRARSRAGASICTAPSHERGWRRLRAIPGIGSWTVEMLALHGQGRHDQVPAGDLGLLKLVGRLLSGGDPRARAQRAAGARVLRALRRVGGAGRGARGGRRRVAAARRAERLAAARAPRRARSSANVGQAWAARVAWSSSSRVQRRARRGSGSPTRRA